MYKFLKKREAKEYYSKYYPKMLQYWQKYGHNPYPIMLKLLNIKNKRMLDIGCGNGLMLKNLIKNNEIYGIDISKKLLKEAEKIGVKTLCHDIDKPSNFPYPPNYFDVIFMFELIEHIFLPKSLFLKCSKVLKKDGKIYMTTPNRLYPRELEKIQESLEKALNFIYGKNIPEKAKRFPDANIPTVNQIKEMLSSTSLKIEKVYGFDWKFEEFDENKIKYYWLHPSKCTNLLVVIKKK